MEKIYGQIDLGLPEKGHNSKRKSNTANFIDISGEPRRTEQDDLPSTPAG